MEIKDFRTRPKTWFCLTQHWGFIVFCLVFTYSDVDAFRARRSSPSLPCPFVPFPFPAKFRDDFLQKMTKIMTFLSIFLASDKKNWRFTTKNSHGTKKALVTVVKQKPINIEGEFTRRTNKCGELVTIKNKQNKKKVCYVKNSPRLSRDPVAIWTSVLAGRRSRRWRRRWWWYLGVFADRGRPRWWLTLRWPSLARHRSQALWTSRSRTALRARFCLWLDLVSRFLRIVPTTRHHRLQFFTRRRR